MSDVFKTTSIQALVYPANSHILTKVRFFHIPISNFFLLERVSWVCIFVYAMKIRTIDQTRFTRDVVPMCPTNQGETSDEYYLKVLF